VSREEMVCFIVNKTIRKDNSSFISERFTRQRFY
jgi:hypothetical protein